MTLVRSGSVALVLAASLVAIGCGASSSSPDTAAALTPGASAAEGDTSSALVMSKVEGAATLDIASEDGACASIRSLIEGRKSELQKLCADKQIPVPVAHDGEGCEAGNVKKITFECVAVNLPPMPESGCRDIEVKDEAAPIAEGGELPGALVCPRLGGAPPTDAEAGGGEANERPQPPMPTGDRPQPPKPPTGDRPEPPLPPKGEGERPVGADGGKLPPPPPPKGLKCCAPPPGGKGPQAPAPQAK